jgi:magnesium chelatase subunit D
VTAPVFPLSAIVGSEQLIEALLVNAVSPAVGGVLVRGQRGTAKSTAVRALASLLPAVDAAASEPFAFAPGESAPGGVVALDAALEPRPAPLVELPLGTTLDRLVGSLDLGRALAGERAFEAGLLARAHRGILYVDEVNLLSDHLVDALLDAAATGVARVEREAVSVTHEARFLLVGTMNVEEGELRPQLLDRFGLGVEVLTPTEPAVRAEIVRRRIAFERDPAAFLERFADAEAELADRIAAARAALPGVLLSERELLRIAGACAQLRIDGVRGDIVTARAACALAAFDGVEQVTDEHVRRAALLALAHRRRRDPLAPAGEEAAELERALREAGAGAGGDEQPEPTPPDRPRPDGGAPAGPGGGAWSGTGDGPAGGAAGGSGANGGVGPDQPGPGEPDPVAPAPDRAAAARTQRPESAQLPLDALRLAGTGAGPTGRRARAHGTSAGAVDTVPAGPEPTDLALVASLRARLLGADPQHLREHVRAGRESALLCLVVDASGSMGARRRITRVKGALLALLRDAYARRDRMAVIAFSDLRAELLVAPGAPLEQAARRLSDLSTGGRTPLADGLRAADELIRREALRDRSRRAVAVILTDGRVADAGGEIAHAARALGRSADAVHVIDTEDGPVRVGIAPELAAAAGGVVHALVAPPARRRAA